MFGDALYGVDVSDSAVVVVQAFPQTISISSRRRLPAAEAK